MATRNDSTNKFELIKEEYIKQRSIWPQAGKHILAHFDEDTLVVYQAYKPSIASYAVTHQTFGGPDFSFDRMSWIKPNFMWMMYRCGWAQKKNQERVLAIWLTRSGFEDILAKAKSGREATSKESNKSDEVRIQWDPDHDPHGEKQTRKAIQLGLRGRGLEDFAKRYIVKIEDITDFVAQQFQVLSQGNSFTGLLCPRERVFVPSKESTRVQIDLDFLPQQTVVAFAR